ncbi:MAG: hypothetical protein P1U37_18005 [Minwuia sp.]|nr:hypothetical protein [Minwuia sp.]
MAIRNDDRVFVAAVRTFATTRGLSVEALSHDWLLILTADNGQRFPILGYDIGLNSATTLRIANDKAATADMLAATGIDHIPHRLFLNPDLHVFTRGTGNWESLRAAFADAGHDVVLKGNEGTSGKGVHRVCTLLDLERVTHDLFRTERAIALSPWIAISRETRFVVLDGSVQLAYAKTVPALAGDGVASVRTLVARAMTPEMGPSLGAWLEDLEAEELDRVPQAGEILPVGWRHNLGQGGGIAEVSADAAGHAVALAAAAALNLRFGSVDIAHTVDGGHRVMEVNAGVMLEHFARSGAERRAQVVETYHDALARLVSSPTP